MNSLSRTSPSQMQRVLPGLVLLAVTLVAASCGNTAQTTMPAVALAAPVAETAGSTGDDPYKPESPAGEQEEGSRELEQTREAAPVEPRCEIEYLGDDLSSNRSNSLPSERLQLVLFYDGEPSSSPELHIGIGADDEIVVGGERAGGPLETFGKQIETREYQLFGCAPNGSFMVSGVVPNGVVDGLAFALMWRGADGRYTMIKSNTVSSTGATYVGMWPLGFSRESFAERTPQISDEFGRETARSLIIGSALMPNGTHILSVPSSGE